MDDDRHLISHEASSTGELLNSWISPKPTQQYHPLVDTAFWIGHKLWGESMWGYHFLNILLHATSALLLWNILLRLQIPGGWLAAAIFALHPVHVESVAWIAELKNTLSGVLFFLAFAAYLKFDEERSKRSYALVLILFCLGLTAKTIVAMLPVAILIALWWKRGRLAWKRDVWPLGPFFVIGIAAGFLTGWMEQEFSGAKGEMFAFSGIERCLIAGRAFWFYLAKLFWPLNLILIYPRWNVLVDKSWQYFFPIAAVLVFALSWLLRRQWRWPLASLLFFALLLLPMAGFFNVHFFNFSFVADHFQYLPSVGVITPVAAGAQLYLVRLGRTPRALGYFFCVTLLAVLSILTWRQSHMYRDAETCYRIVLERNPSAWAAQSNLGNALLQKGLVDEALVHLKTVLELSPAESAISQAAHVNMGNALLRKGLPDEAIAHFGEALRIRPDANVYNSLGSALHRQGKLTEAITAYEKALEMSPQSVSVLNNLAWLLATCSDASLRNGTRALELAHRANSISAGGNPVYLRTLAAAYAETEQFPDAIATAQHALELINQKANNSLGSVVRHELDLYQAGLPCRERPKD